MAALRGQAGLDPALAALLAADAEEAGGPRIAAVEVSGQMRVLTSGHQWSLGQGHEQEVQQRCPPEAPTQPARRLLNPKPCRPCRPWRPQDHDKNLAPDPTQALDAEAKKAAAAGFLSAQAGAGMMTRSQRARLKKVGGRGCWLTY